jgi:hypothetical protein
VLTSACHIESHHTTNARADVAATAVRATGKVNHSILCLSVHKAVPARSSRRST